MAEGTKFLSVAVDETSLKLPNGIARRPEAFCGGFCGEFDVSADLDMLTSCMEYRVITPSVRPLLRELSLSNDADFGIKTVSWTAVY